MTERSYKIMFENDCQNKSALVFDKVLLS